MNTRYFVGVIAAASAAMCWGSATVFSKMLLHDVNPSALLLLQLTASVFVLWSCVGWTARGGVPASGDRWSYAWLGALEPALAYFLGLSGLVRTKASGATLIQATESIMIIAVTAVVTRKFPSRAFLGLSVLSLVAVGLALNVGTWVGGERNSVMGVVLVGAGTLSAAFYVVLSGRVANRASALTVTAYQQSVALGLILIGFFFGTLRSAQLPALFGCIDRTTWLLCVASGLLQFALPFSLYMAALQRIPANVAGAALLLTPLVGLIESHTFLAEQLTTRQWVATVAAVAATGGIGIIGTKPE